MGTHLNAYKQGLTDVLQKLHDYVSEAQEKADALIARLEADVEPTPEAPATPTPAAPKTSAKKS